MRRTLPVALLLVSVFVSAAETEVRSFKLTHRRASEAVVLVAQLLSPEGSVVLQPQHNTILVRDVPQVVERVAILIRRWDAPPVPYRVGIRLILASNVEPTPRAVTGPHFRPDLEAVVRATPGPSGPYFRTIRDELTRLFRYRYYTDLDTIAVTASDGGRVEVLAAERYYVRFTLRVLPGDPNRVQLAQLELQRQSEEERAVEKVQPLLRANISLRVEQTSVIATASSEDAAEALVLVFTAQKEESR